MNTAPTTRETADHAELLLMANASLEIYTDDVLVVGGTRRIHADNIILAVKNGVDRLIANEAALLSEIAALRGGMENLETAAFAYQDRATQAERQRDELLNAWRDDGIDLEDFGRIVARLANQGADQ